MENEKTISILNDLLTITNDRLEGYEKVEGKIWEMNHDLQNSYEQMTTQTKIMKNDLHNLITQSGGEAKDSGSISGAIHRTWIDIKNSVLVASLEKSTLQNVLFGEEAAIQAYQEAMDSGDLRGEAYQLVRDQLASIKDSCREFKGKLENMA